MVRAWQKGCRFAVAAVVLGAASPVAATDDPDGWHLRTTVYVFMPDIKGKQSFPAAQDIHVDFSDLLKRTEFSFMGVAEVRYRRFGAFADVIYLDLGRKKNDTDRIGTGAGPGVPLPPGITADLKFDAKTWIVTMAGYYRAIDSEDGALDLFAGARLNRNKARLDFAFSAPFGPFVGPLQQGSVGETVEIWDAVAGAKGRVNFGPKREWFVLSYGDVGTGDSKSTWQVFVGGGRRIGPVDAIIGWRKLSYRPASSSRLEHLSYSGPMVGASVSF
jgi:hypothetical protein